jgi:hypothetical protein
MDPSPPPPLHTPGPLGFFLAVLCLVLLAAWMVLGQRGMCKWTHGNSLTLTFFKMLLNLFTGNLLAVGLNFGLPEPCTVQKAE